MSLGINPGFGLGGLGGSSGGATGSLFQPPFVATPSTGASQPFTSIVSGGAFPVITQYAEFTYQKVTLVRYRSQQCPRVQPGAPWYFYSKINTGNAVAPSDSNDGRDPLGFNLTAATLSVSGGVITVTQTGKFTSYTLALGDVVYLGAGTPGTGGIFTPGLYHVATKVDTNNITLSTSPVTGTTTASAITSSTGPRKTTKQLNIDIAAQAAAATNTNFRHMSGVAQRWDPISDPAPNGIAVSCANSGAGGIGVITITGGGQPGTGYAAGQNIVLEPSATAYIVKSVTQSGNNATATITVTTAITSPGSQTTMNVSQASPTFTNIASSSMYAAQGIYVPSGASFSFDSWGRGPKPIISAGVVMSGTWTQSASPLNSTYQVTCAGTIAWIRETAEDTVVYRQMETANDVEFAQGSWTQLSGTLSCHYSTDSKALSNTQIEVFFDCAVNCFTIAPQDGTSVNGLRLYGYGCRKNYIGLNTGISPVSGLFYDNSGSSSNDPQRNYTIQAFITTGQGIVCRDLTAMYAMNHNIGILSPAGEAGGYMMCQNCKVGHNTLLDTPFVKYSGLGGDELIIWACESTCIYLPIGVACYTNGCQGTLVGGSCASGDVALCIIDSCTIKAGPFQAQNIGGAEGFLSTWTDPINSVGFRINCVQEAGLPTAKGVYLPVIYGITATLGADTTLTVTTPEFHVPGMSSGAQSPMSKKAARLFGQTLVANQFTTLNQAIVSSNAIQSFSVDDSANILAGQTSLLYEMGMGLASQQIGSINPGGAGGDVYSMIDYAGVYNVRMVGQNTNTPGSIAGTNGLSGVYGINSIWNIDGEFYDGSYTTNASSLQLFANGAAAHTAAFYNCRLHAGGFHGSVEIWLGGVQAAGTALNYTVQNCLVGIDGGGAGSTTVAVGYRAIAFGNNNAGTDSPLLQQSNTHYGYTDFFGTGASTLAGISSDLLMTADVGTVPLNAVPDYPYTALLNPNATLIAGKYPLQWDALGRPRQQVASGGSPCNGPFEPPQVGYSGQPGAFVAVL